MKVYLASDHAGFDLKESVKIFLLAKGYDLEDCGAYTFEKDDDYPDFIGKASEKVSLNPIDSVGIILGGSGQGEMIVANKYKNIRCGVFYKEATPLGQADVSGRASEDKYEIVRLLREHNDANMLSIAARFLLKEEVLKAVEIFLNTAFSGDPRHTRRIGKISEIEQK